MFNREVVPLALVAGVAIVVFGCASQFARASLLVYEPFNYPAGALDGQGDSSDLGFQNGTTWQNGGGTADANQVVSPGLQYVDSSGHSLSVEGNALDLPGTEVDYRDISATYGSAGQTLWISLLAQGQDSGNYAGVSLINTNLSSKEILFLGQPSTNHWGFSDYSYQNGTGDNTQTAVSTNPASQAFLVYEISVPANGTGYTIDMWVDPQLGSSLTSSPDASEVNTTDKFLEFNQLVLHSNESAQLDEFRIGTTYADVAPIASPVPEPSSASMIAPGILTLLLAVPSLRKRRPV